MQTGILSSSIFYFYFNRFFPFFFYHLNTILGAIISLHAYIYTFQNCVFSPPLSFLFSFFFLENMYFFVLYIIYVSLYFSYYRTYITLLRLLCVFPRRIYTTGQVDIVDDTTSTSSSSSSYSKRRCTTVRMLLQNVNGVTKRETLMWSQSDSVSYLHMYTRHRTEDATQRRITLRRETMFLRKTIRVGAFATMTGRFGLSFFLYA